MAEKKGAEDRRKARVRRAIKKAANGRPRLSVFRSSKQIYAQIIDDMGGRTLAAASSTDAAVRGEMKHGANVAAAKAVGKAIRASIVAVNILNLMLSSFMWGVTDTVRIAG